MSLLDDITARLGALPAEQRAAVLRDAMHATAGRKFIPSPGPQTEAYFCKADCLLYGGSAGGGKSSLISGLALDAHSRTLIVRRQVGDLDPIIDEVLKLYGSRDGFNGSVPQRLRFGTGKQIKFGGVTGVDDWQKFQGDPRDLLAVDEAAQFIEFQIRMLMAWVRTDIVGQRRRTVLASNPPLQSQGDYLIGMFRPWLDLTHPDPARHGELRWFVTDPDGKDMEVPDATPHPFPGQREPALPQSRTFIPASFRDNPYLMHDSKYQAQLDSLPEPMRSALRDGNFMAARQDSEWQVIPTQWIREAQARWSPEPPRHAPMSCLAVDVAQGGGDTTTLAARYDDWFAPLEQHPGSATPTGNEVAGLVIAKRRNGCTVVVDVGGGYGGATIMRLKDNGIDATAHNGAKASVRRTKDNQLGFFNYRAEVAWRLREALDPGQDGGATMALPDDPELVSDLTADQYEITSRGIKVKTKDDVIATLGRSPDKGDAVKMAWSTGPKLMTHGNAWRDYGKTMAPGRKVTVQMGHQAARRGR